MSNTQYTDLLRRAITPGSIVPVDLETTAGLCAEIKRLHEREQVLVEALRKAIKKLDADGDEHGVAADLRAALANTQPAPSQQAEPEPLTDEQLKALGICIASGHVSVSEVQRKLGCTYGDAQTICQSLVDRGVTGGLTLAPSLKQPAYGIKKGGS